MYVYRFLCIVNRFFFFFVHKDISLLGYSEIRVEIKFMLCYVMLFDTSRNFLVINFSL